MKMICPNCRKEYNEKMTCCISCGADLVEVENDAETAEIDLSQEVEPLVNSDISESVQIHPETVVCFDSENMVVPVKHITRKTALSDFARVTGSLVTAVLMFALILTSAAAAGFRLLTDKNKIADFTDRLDIMALPAAVFIDNGSATIQDAVYTMSQGTGLTRDNIRTIYENSTAKKFIAAQLTGYAEYIRNGTAPERITAEQLKKVFEENIPLIDSTMGYPLNEHDIALAGAEIERAEPLLEMLSHENVEKTIGENTLVAIRIFSSVPTIVCTAILAASMLLIFRGINKKGTRVLNWGGGTVLAGGVAVLSTAFLFSVQLPYSNMDRFVRTVLKCVCDVISPDMYRIGGTLVALGIVMLIWAESLRRNTSEG